MAIYVFQAKSARLGKTIRGEVEANSEVEARVKIRSQKLNPTKVVLRETEMQKKRRKGSRGGIKSKELQVFTRQFAVLIGAGVAILQSLEAMVGGGRSARLNSALNTIISEIQAGKRLGEAMGEEGKIFDTMYISLINAGEEAGVLDVILNRLAEYIEKSVKLKRKIVGAMWYPAVILLVAGAVVVGMLVFFIPTFAKTFASMGQELPALTMFVLNLSEWFQEKWYFAIGIPVTMIIGVVQYYKTPGGRQFIDTYILDVPVFGDLILKGAIARFTRTLSTMLTAGVRIVDALDISKAAAQNWMIEDIIEKAKQSISKGNSFAEPLQKTRYIPKMVGQMIFIGEQTGSLDSMLGKIADFYEDEVESAVGVLTSLIEPMLMVVLGGVIGFLVVAMYLPIFNMASGI